MEEIVPFIHSFAYGDLVAAGLFALIHETVSPADDRLRSIVRVEERGSDGNSCDQALVFDIQMGTRDQGAKFICNVE